jgi:hypothetical protein
MIVSGGSDYVILVWDLIKKECVNYLLGYTLIIKFLI